MDVICERCETEYELDDALVSERGTTVKCTNCAHQFKVFRPERGDGTPERWIVRKASGRELVFTSLRELQRAIEQGRIEREDLLSRGSSAARRLGDLSELSPFFPPEPAQAPAAPRSTSPSATTLVGIPGPAVHDPPATSEAHEPAARETPAEPALPSQPTSLPEPPSLEPTPSDFLASYGQVGPDSDLAFYQRHPKRSRAPRILVALIVLGGLGFAGATVGRPYLEDAISKMKPEPAADARLSELLAEGERSLSRGDLEGASEAFNKATILAEDHPQLLEALAKLALVRADFDWLKLRLIPAEPEEVARASERALEDAALRARKAVEGFGEAAPDAALLARIDYLRISGDLAGARALVAKGLSPRPETAYVLAMLDLSEEAPNFPTIIDRLRSAAAAEGELARARAVLVYALVRSNELVSAKSELAKILGARHPHPLAAELQAFVLRAETSSEDPPEPSKPRASEKAEVKAADTKAPEQAAPPQAPAIPGQYHELMRQASTAKAAGDLDRAEQLYRVALSRNPGDTEALGGLGDIARSRGDIAKARGYYEQAHERNPHYLPVVAALADMRWTSGDRSGARPLYRQIVDTAPATTLAIRARERLAQMEKDEASDRDAPEAPDEPSPRAESPTAEEPAPEIDRDLPDFER